MLHYLPSTETETWMSAEIPDSAIEPVVFAVHRADKVKDLSGKRRGGGVCFMINTSWCGGVV